MSKGRERKLKVYYGYGRNYRQVPVIHLSGNYLANAGFKIGDAVDITIEDNIILISKPEPKALTQ